MLIYLSMIESEEDKSKFEMLYLSYRKTMFYVANKILNDKYLSENVVHDAFLRIINNLEKIGEVKCHKTKAFIVIIVQNIAIDFYRKRKRNNTTSYDEIRLYVENIDEIENNTDNNIEVLILKLPIIYSSVLMLKYCQGYSNREIADILKLSEVNVRKRISRAKQMLEIELKNIGVDVYE